MGIGTLPNPLVTLVYHDAALDPSAPGYRELILQQQRWAGIGPFILHQPLEVGRIGDQPAAFWTRRNSASVPVVGGMERSLVMWECGELLLTLDATGFSRDELVQVAQGLTDQP